MRKSSSSLLTTLSFATLALFALAGCEDRAFLKFSQAQSAQAEGDVVADVGGGGGGSGGGGEVPSGGPGSAPSPKPVDDIDKDIDDDDKDDHDDDDDDSDGYCGKDKRSTFYRKLQTVGVDWERKLSLVKDSKGADQCQYDRSLVAHNVDIKKSATVKLDKCSGFLKAREIYAKNGGACKAQEIKIRSHNVVSVSDYRYLALGADCTCYYGRELKVAGVLEKVRKRFAKTEVCVQNFQVWKDHAGMSTVSAGIVTAGLVLDEIE